MLLFRVNIRTNTTADIYRKVKLIHYLSRNRIQSSNNA